MRKLAFATTVAALTTTIGLAGGGWFVISLGQPKAHPDPRARASAFVVQVYGCGSLAEVRATAEGLVNGERRTITVQPIRLTERTPAASQTPSSTVAIPRVWPAEGTWVVKVVASAGWRSQSALVALGADGIDRGRTRLQDTFQAAEIDTALRALDTQGGPVQVAQGK